MYVYMFVFIEQQQIRKYIEQAKINDEKEELCLYKLVIFGPSRVGKSSLFQILLGNTPKKKLKSTGIFKLQMFKVAITKTATLSWHEINIEDEIAHLRYLLEENVAKQKPDLQDKDARKPSDPLDVENMICEKVNQPVERINTLMVCYDSGGQPEFFDVMPLLATNLTGYIMVLDISKDPDEPIQSKANVEGTEHLLPDKISSIDMMKSAIASIQSCSGYTSHHNLLVVGTHLDECPNPKEKIPELDKQIIEKLVERGGEALFRKRQGDKSIQAIQSAFIHPVANFIESETIDDIDIKKVTKSSVQEIYRGVENMSKNRELHEEISIKSLLLLLQIQLKLKDAPYYITKIEYSKYAESCRIDSNDVDEILEHFHKLGFIFYFKKDVKDVVFSPQWVFNRLSDIIFEKYTKNSIKEENIKKGQIKKDIFGELFQPEIDHKGAVHTINEEGIEHLRNIFIGQNIMAEEDNFFFMPALLSPGSLDDESFIAKLQADIEEYFGSRIYERLYVEFKNHYFPRVIFCYLATQFLHKNWKIQPEPRYNNILVFQVEESDQYFGLFDYKTKLAVELYIKKGKGLCQKPHKICEFLYHFITKCCEKIQIDCNFKFGFTCKKFKNCALFAGVYRQYPYSAKKHCENCTPSTLNKDELIWLTSPEIVDIMVRM